MAVTLEKGSESPTGGNGAQPLHFYGTLPKPDLGRSVRYVGEVKNVDMNQSPHPMNQRGELGPAAFNLQHNTISKDPFVRVSAPNHFADRRHFLTNVVNQASKGQVNPKRVEVTDAAAMTRHIKDVARHMGADVVAIAAAHPNFMYAGNRYVQDGTAEDSHQQDTPADLVRKFPYLIFVTTAWPYETLQAHRHLIGDSSYHVSQMKGNMILKALEGYVKELGYTALRGVANPQATAIAAGVGELGRNGLVINEKFGARVHMPDPIMTDLPLVADSPVDIGVSDFCTVCRKCAVTCPTNSITFDDRDPKNGKELTRDTSGFGVYNGIEKFKINWRTCYALRPYTHEYWNSCLTCAAICPFTKPNTWWHTAAITWLRTTPIPARPLVVKTLKAIDDKFWGTIRNKRVRWLGYDSGIKPGEQACTVAGCTADHGAAASKAVDGDVGYYFPLKENTNRFVKRGLGMALKLGPLSLPWIRGDSHKDDPYWDFFINTPPVDPENSAVEMMARAPEGNVFPTRSELHTPEITSSQVKELGAYLGADMVGIAALKPGENEYPYAVLVVVKADHDTKTARGIGGQVPAQNGLYVTFVLSAWMRELGYRATSVEDPEAERLAAQAKLGTLNARGRPVTPAFGDHVHVARVIKTDLPLAVDG